MQSFFQFQPRRRDSAASYSTCNRHLMHAHTLTHYMPRWLSRPRLIWKKNQRTRRTHTIAFQVAAAQCTHASCNFIWRKCRVCIVRQVERCLHMKINTNQCIIKKFVVELAFWIVYEFFFLFLCPQASLKHCSEQTASACRLKRKSETLRTFRWFVWHCVCFDCSRMQCPNWLSSA